MNAHDGVILFFFLCLLIAAVGGIVILGSKILRSRKTN